MRREKIINQISERLHTVAPFARTILFGSEARREAREDSDIDILIVLPDYYSEKYNIIRKELIDELYMIELETEVMISPIILLQKMWDSKKTPFTCNVEKDGILL